MKHSLNKLAWLLGIGAALTLPGLATAEARDHHSFKYAVQQSARDHQRHAPVQYVRHERHNRYDHRGNWYHRGHHGHKHRHGYHGRWGHKNHHGHGHHGRWGHHGHHIGHYHQGHYCTIRHGHGYGRINGYYMTPQLGLHIVLR